MKNTIAFLLLLGGLFVTGCNKEDEPQNLHQNHAPTSEIEVDNPPDGGDDDDEQIIIRGHVVNHLGAPISNAELHLFNSGYSIYSTTGFNGSADLVAPDTGMYIYEIRINSLLLHADTLHYTQPLTWRTDTL